MTLSLESRAATERAAEMVRMFLDGAALADIASKFAANRLTVERHVRTTMRLMIRNAAHAAVAVTQAPTDTPPPAGEPAP